MNLARLRYHTKRYLRDAPLGELIVAEVMKLRMRLGRSPGLSTSVEIAPYFDQAIADLTANGAGRLTYFEAGVYNGNSLALWSERCEAARVESRIFGADSFAGLPDSVVDDEGSWFPGAFYCPRSVTEWNLRRRGVPMESVCLIEGWFDRSLTPTLATKVGTVHVAMIDADAYSSTVPVLQFLGPLLADRTWLIFDDWYSGGNLDAATGKTLGTGVERAFNEWRSQDGFRWQVMPIGDYDFELGDGNRRLAGQVLRLDATTG